METLAADPTVLGAFRYNAGSFRMRDSIGVFNPRDGTVAGIPAAMFWGNGSVSTTTTTRYMVPGYEATLARTTTIGIPVTSGGTIKSLYVRHNIPAGNGNVIVYTVLKNGVATTLTASLASTGTSASDLVNSFTVVTGDVLSLQVTKAAGIGSSPTDVYVTVGFSG